MRARRRRERLCLDLVWQHLEQFAGIAAALQQHQRHNTAMTMTVTVQLQLRVAADLHVNCHGEIVAVQPRHRSVREYGEEHAAEHATVARDNHPGLKDFLVLLVV